MVEDSKSAMKMWRRRWVAESKDLLSCSLRDSRGIPAHRIMGTICSLLLFAGFPCIASSLRLDPIFFLCSLSLSLSLSCPNCGYPTPSLLLSSQIFSDGFVSGWFCVDISQVPRVLLLLLSPSAAAASH